MQPSATEIVYKLMIRFVLLQGDHMYRMFKGAASVFFLTLVFTFAAVQADTTVIDGVAHVKNGTTPANGSQTKQLQELWRIGGDDEDVLLGAASLAIMDDAGNTYLMDTQLNHVLMLSPEGELLNTLGGEGEGPGEIRGLSGIFLLPDNMMGMIQAFPGRIITINRDGTPGSSFNFTPADAAVANFGVLVGANQRAGTFIMTGMTMSMNGPVSTQNLYLSSCDVTGKELNRFYAKASTIDYSGYNGDELALDFAWSRWDIGPDGSLYCAPDRNSYRVEVHNPDGTLVRVIERAYESYERNDKDTELVGRFVEAVYNNYPVKPLAYNIEKLDADITSMRVNPNGELWIMNSHGGRNQADGIAVSYDIFDKEGNFDRQVSLVGDFDPNRDLIQFIGKDKCLVVVGAGEGYLNSMGVAGGDGGEEEAPLIEAICYQLK
jgi:hypothetical protein